MACACTHAHTHTYAPSCNWTWPRILQEHVCRTTPAGVAFCLGLWASAQTRTSGEKVEARATDVPGVGDKQVGGAAGLSGSHEISDGSIVIFL